MKHSYPMAERLFYTLPLIWLYFGMTALLTSPAYAENPWAQRFQKSSPSMTKEAPERAPAVSYDDVGRGQYHFDYDDAEYAVASALVHEGAGEQVRVIIDPRKPTPLKQHNAPLSVEIDDLFYNAKTLTWSATLYFTSVGRPLSPVKLEGRYEELIEVPTIRRRLRKDDIIQASDIEPKAIASNRLKNDTILDANQLIGRTPLRTISPGRAIRSDEIITPPVIFKGDKVTMLYAHEGLEIKALGEALENGAEGEYIRIRNTDSNIVIEAEIAGPGLVKTTGLNQLNERQ